MGTQDPFKTKKRSTIYNLIVYTIHIFENMDPDKQTGSIYTDFQKAFDRVDHKILLKKDYLQWNFYKSLEINGYALDSVLITSRLPQGSILILFFY